jgi:hypothetical protein
VDVKGAALLYTMAGLMVTFAGFSAILLSVRQAAGARLSVLDRYLARTVFVHLFALTAAALLPPLLSLYDIPESAVWKIAAAIFGLPMLLLLLTYPQRRRKVVGGPPPGDPFCGVYRSRFGSARGDDDLRLGRFPICRRGLYHGRGGQFLHHRFRLHHRARSHS